MSNLPSSTPRLYLGLSGATWYRSFKYAIYLLLSYDAVLFLSDELLASAEVYAAGAGLLDMLEAYSATIDTVAWVVLLLAFEVETAVLRDQYLKGPVGWGLAIVRVACYFFIFSATYGYWLTYGVVSNIIPFAVDDPCSLIGTAYTYVVQFDEYLPLTPAVCAELQAQPLYQIASTQIIGTGSAMTGVRYLAIVDIVNAFAWLGVVAVLEVEAYLQPRALVRGWMAHGGRVAKAALYATLLACAIYWGLESDFLDFWDAFLWLVAFIFIEMNFFQFDDDEEEEEGERKSTEAAAGVA